jgi:hypothetical protein
VLNLAVVVYPQPGGGVLVKIRGNDQEGIRERRFEFAEWAEGLPKRGVVTTLSEGETREMTPAPSGTRTGQSRRGAPTAPGRG